MNKYLEKIAADEELLAKLTAKHGSVEKAREMLLIKHKSVAKRKKMQRQNG
jgi:hypothetical protein